MISKAPWEGVLLIGMSAASVCWIGIAGDCWDCSFDLFSMYSAAIPLWFTWICFFCIRLSHKSQPWHLTNMIALSVISLPLYHVAGDEPILQVESPVEEPVMSQEMLDRSWDSIKVRHSR